MIIFYPGKSNYRKAADLSATRIVVGVIIWLTISILQVTAQELTSRVTSKAVNTQFINGENIAAGTNLSSTAAVFIRNVGQYGDTLSGIAGMQQIIYGYEGFDMPVLFTPRGLIYLQRTVKQPSEEAREEMERKGFSEEEIMLSGVVKERTVTMRWLNANPHPEIVASAPGTGYFTYGRLPEKALSYKKITYKELYPGIDIEYSFTASSKRGFEYKIVVRPGADLSVLQLEYGGDVVSVRQDQNGGVTVKTGIGKINETAPVTYYAEDAGSRVMLSSRLENNVLRFTAPADYDRHRTLIIDPFISAATNLTGTNAGKAKDVDFDYAGNIYVTGGGDGNVYQLAKYNASGAWQWTFNGSLSIPYWTFGTYYGGWVVEKNTGSIYLGQGFNYATGFAIVRINTAGLYDNYITATNVNFREDWKMYWSCNSGVPKILIAGGGTNSNINFGICSPPSTVLSSLNVTNIAYSTSSGWAQDIADIIIDPVTNDMYTIYGSLIGTPSLCNMIYKNTSPYSGATVSWSVNSGFTVIQEIANRPYMTGGIIENSCNVFAINSSYLFYWDGKNLKAINKATGAGVGASLTIAANTALWSGGIIADECNNVFVGSVNGTIKVYHFNGAAFDDAAKPDITITGYTTKSVYDLAYDEANTLLYASGDGFVASFDVTAYGCANTSYTITPSPNCATASVSTTLSPAPPSGSVINYYLYTGSTLVATNSTGTFTGLTPGVTYTIIAFINQTCSGTSTTADFFLPGPALTLNSTNTLCGSNTGTISASGAGGSLPYTFSIDGVLFQVSGSFTNLGAGVYTVTIKDAGGCSTTDTITIINSNGPSLSFTKTDALCSSNNGTITANGSGGAPPLEYSIDGSTFQLNNFFTGLNAGTYTLTVKDATGCLNEVIVLISNTGGPVLTATPAATYCNSNNGKITAFATGGTAPLQYSIDGNNFQVSNVFTGLAAGSYTVTVMDANGCIGSYAVTIANSAGPTVTATTTAAACGNSNGTITATGLSGTAPLQYSINGVTFQSSGFFGGLTAGSYTVTVKDANGCTSTFSTTVGNSNAPTVTATTVSATCNTSNGSVTATGSGGTAPLTFSINGFTFQASGLFSGLAPGSYTILVKDALGCIGATIVAVTNTSGPSVSAMVTPAACGANNGIITANGTGGTGLLQYSLNNGTYQVSSIFSGLSTGTYTLTVKDANGCISTITVIMTNASGLSLTASSIATPCSGSDGIVTAIAAGGVGLLQYSIDGSTFQSSNIFTGLAAGIYTVTVQDANGCSANATVTVSIIFSPTITAAVTNANCTSSNGIITATGSGGTPPYTYSIDGVNFQSSNVISALAPGTYTVTIKDAAGCTGTTSVTIINVGSGPPPSITIIKADNIPCDGSGDPGEIKVSGTGGTGPYQFSFEGGPFSNTNNWDIDTAGTYSVTIKDANGCTTTIEITISVDVAPGLTATVTNSVCGSSTGIIVASGSGGEPPYKYSLNGGPYQSSGTFSGLAPGTYTITIKDDEGDCKPSITVNVLSIGGPTVTLVKTDAMCGLINGTITATGVGNAPLTYNLNNGAFQSSNVFSGLNAGTYTVLIKDAIGCLGAAIISISAFSAPSVNAVATGTSCGLINGTITANGSGGSGTLQYSLNGTTYQTSTVFTGLASGSYTVWVVDPGGCFANSAVSVPATSSPLLTAYGIPASCGNATGSIVGTGSGGTSPYQFSIDGSTFQSSGTFSGLAAGAYTLTIKDLNDCQNTTIVNVPNLNAPTLSTSATSSKCGNANGTITGTGSGGTPPLQYSIDGVNFQSSGIFNGVAAGIYTVTVKDGNGCITTKLVDVANIEGPSTLTANIIAATCGNNNGKLTATATGGTGALSYSLDGSTYQAGTVFTPLAAGTYTLWVKDNNGCTKTITVTIPNLEGPVLTTTTSPSTCYANDGTITATATGGTVAITYNKDGGAYQSSNVFTGLASGVYVINAKDANGCISTANVTVGALAGPSIAAVAISSGCGDGAITATGSGGTPGYEYSIDGVNFQSNNTFDCLAIGTYTITVMDANGCQSSTTVNVTNVLPVSLLYFTAHMVKNVVVLDWSTDSEFNNDYFTVEKSTREISFNPIDTVDGAGSSLVPHSYVAYDVHPADGMNYYRLKQTDFNGNFKYSDVVSAEMVSAFYFQIYPNPAGEYITIVTDQVFNHIGISDGTGRNVMEFKGEFGNKTVLHLTGLSSGSYVLKATSGNGMTQSILFLKNLNDTK
ncbi:MAG: T9SS type A sorting domain-containing protein [Chitinophagales bacterium]|nr:T9SS type A sorting domain-containing protein [Chitinophagales bacterium]